MARKALEQTPETVINSTAVQEDVQAVHTLLANYRQVAKSLQYDGEYDRARLLSETKIYMGQAAEAMLEAGKRLLLLREGEAHGNFLEFLKTELGIASRTAQNMMAATMRYMQNPEIAPHTPKLLFLGRTKLFDLMSAPDDEIIELAQGGTLAGKTLSEVGTMTTDQLKILLKEREAELDEAEKKLQAKTALIDKQAQTITSLQEKKMLVQAPSHDETAQQLRGETTEMAFEAEQHIRTRLRMHFQALIDHAAQNGSEGDAPLKQFMSNVLGGIDEAVQSLIFEFDLPEMGAATAAEWHDAQFADPAAAN